MSRGSMGVLAVEGALTACVIVLSLLSHSSNNPQQQASNAPRTLIRPLPARSHSTAAVGCPTASWRAVAIVHNLSSAYVQPYHTRRSTRPLTANQPSL